MCKGIRVSRWFSSASTKLHSLSWKLMVFNCAVEHLVFNQTDGENGECTFAVSVAAVFAILRIDWTLIYIRWLFCCFFFLFSHLAASTIRRLFRVRKHKLHAHLTAYYYGIKQRLTMLPFSLICLLASKRKTRFFADRNDSINRFSFFYFCVCILWIQISVSQFNNRWMKEKNTFKLKEKTYKTSTQFEIRGFLLAFSSTLFRDSLLVERRQIVYFVFASRVCKPQ